MLLTVGAVVMSVPLVWMLISAFKTQNELFVMPPTFLPAKFSFENFAAVFKAMPFLKYYFNSLATSTVNALFGVLTSTLFGYVFAKYRFPLRNVFFIIVLACMMIPYETLMTSVYKIMVGIKWTNTYLVLLVPYFVNIFGIFMMRQFYLDLPDSYFEAAEIDGCGQLRCYWSVAIPMARSMVAALAIFLFMASYNSFLWPLISVDTRALFTLPVGIASMLSDRGNQMAMLMAASTMVLLPVALVFAVAQKNFIEGLTMGGIKG
jgi:ABC-type glycerol-3-phosphate transport system permease component